MPSTDESMERLHAAFGDALDTVGQPILPAVTEALSGLTDFISCLEAEGSSCPFGCCTKGALQPGCRYYVPLPLPEESHDQN